jgi:citrate lyase beta subunit
VADAYEEALVRGDAAISVDGAMVDEPVARRARALLAEVAG